MRILLVLAALALAACGANVRTDPNLQGLTASAERQQAQALDHARAMSTDRAKAVAACATSTDVAVCMLGLTAIEAVAGTRSGGSDNRTVLPNYTPPPSGWHEFAFGTAALIGAVSPLANAAVSWHQSDVNKDVQIAQFGFLDSIIQSSNNTAASIATAGPRVDVAGDYISGTQHIGDAITGDGNATRGSHVGDSIAGDGNATGGSQAITNSGILNTGNENRFTSPGPISCTSGNGGDGAPGSGTGTDASTGTGTAAPGGPGGACDNGG